jgi:HK97 family phage major capsid protein
MKLHEMQERRTAVVAEMRTINDKAEAESRDYSEAEDKRHKELKAELAGLDRKIEKARDLADAERAAPAVIHSGRLGDGAYEQRARDFSRGRAAKRSQVQRHRCSRCHFRGRAAHAVGRLERG